MSGPPITLGACRSIEGCHGFAGAPRACGGYGGPFGAPHVTRVCSGGGGGAPLARPVDAEPAVPQVRRAVRRRGLVGAADQRPPRDLLHVQGVARAARADPAREGQRRRADDRALRARDRAPDGLDDAAAGGAGPRRARAAADRLRPATAPGARHHRGRLPRRARARAAARLPAGHGRGGRRRRRLQRAALPRDARRTRLVRARVLPQGLGAVHDARRAPRLLPPVLHLRRGPGGGRAARRPDAPRLRAAGDGLQRASRAGDGVTPTRPATGSFSAGARTSSPKISPSTFTSTPSSTPASTPASPSSESCTPRWLGVSPAGAPWGR